jgi:hypothetical protein
MTRSGIWIAWLACAAAPLWAQQVPDRGFTPAIANPGYPAGKGPVVCVDEAHFNFHALGERFWAFGELLRRDGFVLRANTEKFSAGALARCRVLVISNAQPGAEGWDAYPYPTPSAFTADEISVVRDWVGNGGALLLIADHMPLAGAAAQLAAAFAVEFQDGFAQRDPETDAPDIFSREAGTLRDHIITRGHAPGEAVGQVRSFTGQAFRAPKAQPLLVFPAGYVQLMPRVAWEFAADTRRFPVEGWLQGAVLEAGKGRAAFFGEAAMFTAQLTGAEREPVGMNAPGAERNFQLVLNVVHWLTRSL